METFTEDGKKIAYNQNTVFVQGAGGFGGKRSSPKAKPPLDHPKRAPDASIKETTLPDQVSRVRGKGSERGSVGYGVRGVKGSVGYEVRGVRRGQ